MNLTPAQRIEAVSQISGDGLVDFDLIESDEWYTDVMMLHLDHGLSYYDEELFFYFWGFTERQKVNLQRIVIASSLKGTVNFKAVTPAGGPTGFFAKKADGPSELVSADICWFTPTNMMDHDWMARVPRDFDIEATDPTDGVRYFVSSTDTQILFLGLFALVTNGDQEPTVYSWGFPSWSMSTWSLSSLASRSDAALSEQVPKEIEKFYPGATRIRPGGAVKV